MSTLERKLVGGMTAIKTDPRTYKFERVFGSASPVEIPMQDFEIATPLLIKEQYNLDICPGVTTSSMAEDTEDVTLDELFAFMTAKIEAGNWQSWGADPLDAFNAGVKHGFLPRNLSPFTVNDPREQWANPANWPAHLFDLAKPYKQGSFYDVDKTFFGMLSALWLNYQAKQDGKDSGHSIGSGCLFRASWLEHSDGIVPESGWENEQGVQHMFKIYGQKIIDGHRYLKAQLSSGEDAGDHGILYFPQSVVNREFTFFARCFRDLPKSQAKFLNKTGLSIRWLWLAKLFTK